MYEFVFIVKEELEGLVEKLMDKKLYRRDVFCELSYNSAKNKAECRIDEVETSFENEIVPLLSKHFNRAIKNVRFEDSETFGEGFILSY
ncbi:chromosome condensin MukBEF complex kleisin-like MukF subunit [Clostridium beijerinckii]|uniref:hypothetical protein n=1 Tax=Clostridium beijerinckii TaxID=1520 RepID=UPI001494A17F|nr:hypothetical protein [Clostridium beijerinckii]NOW87975.1 chromosome condensin MukBEF complex kleisin-like MukF subunit [Clostridium beijerinckii]